MKSNWAEESACFLADRGAGAARFGVVLGTGLGDFAEHLQSEWAIPYSSIPHFARSTVPGHRGVLHCGLLSGQACLVMAGRFHLYEGYGYDEVTFPILVMRRLGVRTLIVTNAAGGIRPHVRVGDLMLVRDHIGLLGGLPVPPARPETNRRPEYYSQALLQAARSIAAREEIALQEGTLAFMKGPSYETPAELEMLRRIGADAVTMSTVPEVLAAWRAGMRVLGMSIICNLAFGLPRHRVDHCSIIAAARRAQEDYTCLLERLVGSGSIG